MYLVDFLRNIVRKANIPVILYLLANAIFISVIIGTIFTENIVWALIIGFIFYLLMMSVAMSPIGETIVRMQTGCKLITDKRVISQLEPIFNEVFSKAKKMNSNIPDDVQLYMNDSTDVNAFATGRKTVCITRGLLSEPPEIIKATLGHEMGHLAHHDTDLILLIQIGNMIVTASFVFMRILCKIVIGFTEFVTILFGGKEALIPALLIKFSGFITDVMIAIFMTLWTKLGIIMVMKSSRSNEYEADEFSFNLGYGYALCQLLDSFPSCHDAGLFATLMSSHPNARDRIERLRKLGVKY